MTPVRVVMWSGPRNISTAMMRSWENRGDTSVWDEPLYAYYLNATGIEHPGAAEIIAAGERDWRKVVDRILGPVPGGQRVFFQKHMAHHLLPEVDRGWLGEVVNCFLIRDPREVVASYARARDEVVIDDVGVVQQAEIFDHVRKTTGENPPVVDARDVLGNPQGILRSLCERIGLDFTPRMLSWPAGPRPSDGVWAKFWYDSVHSSTGFQPYREKALDLSPELEAIAEACLPHYRKLYRHRIES